MGDVPAVFALLNSFAEKRELLPRSLSEIYENLQQFYVAADHRIIGCCALYPTWEGLAEVKALAVAEDFQGRGWGKKLLSTVIQDAKKLGVETLFTLTIREELFKKFGFKRAKKNVLPHKVWTECVRCPYFPDTCIETSLTLRIGKGLKKSTRKGTQAFMSSAEPMVPSEPVRQPPFPPPPPKYLK